MSPPGRNGRLYVSWETKSGAGKSYKVTPHSWIDSNELNLHFFQLRASFTWSSAAGHLRSLSTWPGASDWTRCARDAPVLHLAWLILLRRVLSTLLSFFSELLIWQFGQLNPYLKSSVMAERPPSVYYGSRSSFRASQTKGKVLFSLISLTFGLWVCHSS